MSKQSDLELRIRRSRRQLEAIYKLADSEQMDFVVFWVDVLFRWVFHNMDIQVEDVTLEE